MTFPLQLVLCGDFCQLPPVSDKDEKGREIPATFAFEAQSWDSCIGAPMMLTKVFRQKDQSGWTHTTRVLLLIDIRASLCQYA